MRSYAALPKTHGLRQYQHGARRLPVSRTERLPAPVGGLNARDSIADMPPTDAVRMTNFFPLTDDIMLREGFTQTSTGLGAQVEGLYSYNKPDGNRSLFASAGANIYDVSAGGAVGAAVVSGQTSARWQHAQFATAAGNFMQLVNGSDLMELYDGTTWEAVTGVSAHAITGVTTSDLVHINVFKKRLWYVQKDSLIMWYLASGAIAGAATSFDLRQEFKKGGFLRAMVTWSIDAGEGLDDYAVFITSEGEAAVYKGTDPASAATFAKVGTFQIGNPIGYRCFEKYGGDVILITRDGLLPLSKALMSDRVNVRIALTDKINSDITALTKLYGSTFGWETQLYPQQNMLLLNIPVTGGQVQYAMNTITKEWGNFVGWNANCFERHGEEIYFGGNGVVCRIWNTYSDNGSNVNGDVLQAFHNFGNGKNKFFKMVKPIITTNGTPGLMLSVNADYDTTPAIGTPTFSASVAGVWGTGLWGTMLWGGTQNLKQDWQTVTAIGVAGAVTMKAASSVASFHWLATQFVMEDAEGTVL